MFPLMLFRNGSNVTSGMPENYHLHGGTVEQFSLTHVIP